MQRYEYAEGTSNKFWAIEARGAQLVTTWGRIGTAGQGTTKSFATADAARAERDRLVGEKLRKGYRLAGGQPPPTAARRPVAAATAKRPTRAASASTAKARRPVKAAAQPTARAVAAPTPTTARARKANAAAADTVAWTPAARRRLGTESRAMAVEPRSSRTSSPMATT